jgi:hypothetical protein
MSLIDNIRGGSGAKPAAGLPQAPAIAKKLEFAQAELSDLERQHGDAALADVLGEPGAADRLRSLNRQLESSQANVATLRSAHTAALAHDDAALRAHRAMLQKTQVNALRQHLAARDKSAERFSIAITEAAAAYHELIERSTKALHTAQAAGFDFSGAEVEHDPLVRLVRCEMHRVSALPGDLPHDMGGQGGHALPGSALPEMGFQHRPEEIPALAERVKQASALTIATLMGNKEPA